MSCDRLTVNGQIGHLFKLVSLGAAANDLYLLFYMIGESQSKRGDCRWRNGSFKLICGIGKVQARPANVRLLL